MAERIVEIFFTQASPWTYLAWPQLRPMLARRGARLRLRPYDFALVSLGNGGIPLRSRPQPRQDYHAMELDRWRRQTGIPLVLRPRHYPPTDARPAGRMVMAAQARGLDAGLLSESLLRALWAEERDIADPAVRDAVAASVGMDGPGLRAAAESAAILAEWDANNAAAAAKGVFGVPSFFLDTPEGELFLWGQDRLPFLEKALQGEAVQTSSG